MESLGASQNPTGEPFRRSLCFLVVVVCCLVLAGCGKSMSGKYQGDTGISVQFDSGKATINGYASGPLVRDYKISGQSVQFLDPTANDQWDRTWYIQSDGSLKTDTGEILKKVD